MADAIGIDIAIETKFSVKISFWASQLVYEPAKECSIAIPIPIAIPIYHINFV